jgi:hypothetical protein
MEKGVAQPLASPEPRRPVGGDSAAAAAAARSRAYCMLPFEY